MTPGFKTTVSMGLSVVALIGFAAMYIYALFNSGAEDPSPVLDRPNFIFLANALAGLVGSVVAAGFGQTLPSPRPANEEVAEGDTSTTVGGVGNIMDAGNIIPPGYLKYISASYTLVYFVVGIAAIVAWALVGVPLIVDTLAGVVLGLTVAILQATLSRVR